MLPPRVPASPSGIPTKIPMFTDSGIKSKQNVTENGMISSCSLSITDSQKKGGSSEKAMNWISMLTGLGYTAGYPKADTDF